jgi:SAM-dependent methyltransferase
MSPGERTLRMSTAPRADASEFDAYAHDYDAELHAGLSATGEDKDYYARGRARWTARRLRQLGVRPNSVLDYGCGTGSAAPFLLEELGASRLLGVDVSAESIRVARDRFAGPATSFELVAYVQPLGGMDVAFCNGVFHHIPVSERLDCATYVRRSLASTGLFAFWENNPWNPGTRYVMRHVAFDRDAITLTPPEARGLLRRAGFEVLRTDYLFVFPATLRWLRGIEPTLAPLPIGGQYLILCRKAAS